MKKAIAKHISSGNLYEVEIYTSFVYILSQTRYVPILDFELYFEIVS